MIIVRETYIAKPGQAGAFAKLMKEEMAGMPDFKARVLLDAVTDYNTIVVEYEMENLSKWAEMIDGYQKQKESKPKDANAAPAAYTQMYQTGKREIFRVVE